jgi:hypothetical protein
MPWLHRGARLHAARQALAEPHAGQLSCRTTRHDLGAGQRCWTARCAVGMADAHIEAGAAVARARRARCRCPCAAGRPASQALQRRAGPAARGAGAPRWSRRTPCPTDATASRCAPTAPAGAAGHGRHHAMARRRAARRARQLLHLRWDQQPRAVSITQHPRPTMPRSTAAPSTPTASASTPPVRGAGAHHGVGESGGRHRVPPGRADNLGDRIGHRADVRSR